MAFLTPWKCTSDKAKPESQFFAQGIGYVVRTRETETQVWEAYASPGDALPAAPLNPGDLTPSGWGTDPTTGVITRIDRWICEDRGWDAEYASPAPKKYIETWRKVGAWQDMDVSA